MVPAKGLQFEYSGTPEFEWLLFLNQTYLWCLSFQNSPIALLMFFFQSDSYSEKDNKFELFSTTFNDILVLKS